MIDTSERLLAHLTALDRLPMHMPGHKRNPAVLHLPFPETIDITEIGGYDNLHDAEDILLRCQQRAARVFGAEETHFLINGTTGGILAAVTACVPRDGTLLLARNCHKSVLNAVILNGITPEYVYPPFLPGSGISGAIEAADIEAALSHDPSIRCVLITSPTYEGILSDIRAISDICHRHSCVLIVDEAHGAHLGFGGFPQGAAALGADIVIQSVHKTLGSLTQTALMHISGHLAPRDALRRALAVFQTSSPSYVLMASIDECVCRMAEEGDALGSAWLQRLSRFRTAVQPMRHLSLLAAEDVPCDPSKIVVSTHGTDMTGPALQQQLRKRFCIETEMAAGSYVIAMTGIGDTDETLDMLSRALLTIDSELTDHDAMPQTDPLIARPVRARTPSEASGCPSVRIPLSSAAGRIAAETVWAYPPGIPLIIPGERIPEAFCLAVSDMLARGVSLHSDTGTLPDALSVKA